jgi:hypothetical protein
MTLEKFPDPKQLRILEFLSDNCHGSDPMNGWDAVALAAEVGMNYDDLCLPVGDLEKRGYVATGHGSSSNPIGCVVITPWGRDFLHSYREAPHAAALARRSRLWHYGWEVIKLVLAGLVGYIVAKLT